MDKDLEVLKRVDEIKPIANNTYTGRAKTFNNIKMVSNNPNFISWREEAKHSLRKLKPNPLIDEIASLLDSFRGYTDERDYQILQSKIQLILDNPEEFLLEDEKEAVDNQRLSKGAFINTAFDDYELIEQIGQGGNGRVFSAIDSNGNDVAIKFVERDIPKRKYKRLKNEINFCEKNEHKNIIRVIDHGVARFSGKDYVFYVMPLYPITLEKKIKAGIEPDVAVTIFMGIIQGLRFAHNKGIIHRDIKPENILFAQGSNEPVICDFGIAHFSEDELLTLVETKPGDRLANFQYAAPEQKIKGGANTVTGKADVYAAGLILNEMFTGEIPQAGGYKTIADVNPEYAFLDELFEEIYQQDPDERLFPAERIIKELVVLADYFKNEQAKKRLEQSIDTENKTEEFEATVEHPYYRDGEIVFVMDKKLPNEWVEILTRGGYSHTSQLGYEPQKLRISDGNLIIMPLKTNYNESTIRSIVTYTKSWISSTNYEYSERLKRFAEEKVRQEETKRKAELKEIERRQSINSLLKDL